MYSIPNTVMLRQKYRIYAYNVCVRISIMTISDIEYRDRKHGHGVRIIYISAADLCAPLRPCCFQVSTYL